MKVILNNIALKNVNIPKIDREYCIGVKQDIRGYGRQPHP